MIHGKRALVTGVGERDGLGFEVAKALVAAGAEVVISGRDGRRGTSLASELGAEFLAADLRDPRQVHGLAVRAGQVDILVNNAATISAGPTTDLELTGYDEMFAVNVRAPHLLVAALAPHMARAGYGQIVNISSIGAKLGTPGRAAYAATKAALESLTRSWAVEFADHGIRVNAVAPGPMHGPRVLRAGPDVVKQMGRSVPLGRTVAPAEVAAAVLFLAGGQADYATGSVLALDGGRTVI